MRRIAKSFLVFAALWVHARGALADLDVTLPNRAVVTATFADGADVHTYRVPCPSGAKLTVSARFIVAAAKAPGRGPSLRVSVLDPHGADVRTAEGRKPALKNVRAGIAGPYGFRVVSADGTTPGTYELSVAWTIAPSSKGAVVVSVGSTGEFTFGAEAGAAATVTLTAAKRSSATPELTEFVTPAGTHVPLDPGTSAAFPCDSTGDYTLHFTGGTLGGAVAVGVKVKPPKASKSPLLLAPGAIPTGVGILVAKTIDTTGGLVSIVEGPLSGSSLNVPAGALGAPTSILLGTGKPLDPPNASTVGGPPVFIGPVGLEFPDDDQPVVTIPYAPEAFPRGIALLSVVSRSAAGDVRPIALLKVDEASHTVTVKVSRSSVFQVVHSYGVTETPLLGDLTAPVAGTRFGIAVAVDGDVAAVGEPPLSGRGAVSVYHRIAGTWFQEPHLLAPSAATDQFGASVAASGAQVVVGAPARVNPNNNTQSGLAFVFVRSVQGVWAQEQVLEVSGSHLADKIGACVDIDHDTTVVGAPYDDTGATDAGAVYVHIRDSVESWALQKKVQSTVRVAGGRFGSSAAVRGDVLVVGAPEENSAAGAVYVFHRTGTVWSQVARIQPADALPFDRFGRTVALDGTTIVVGRNDSSDPGPGPEPVRIFEDQGTAFPEVQRLESADVMLPDETSRSDFGTRLALRGDVLVVGAPAQSTLFPGASVPLNQSGNTYVYRRIGGVWKFATRLRGSATDAYPLASGDTFGGAVATDGATILIGAPSDSAISFRAGAAYLFDVSGN